MRPPCLHEVFRIIAAGHNILQTLTVISYITQYNQVQLARTISEIYRQQLNVYASQMGGSGKVTGWTMISPWLMLAR